MVRHQGTYVQSFDCTRQVSWCSTYCYWRDSQTYLTQSHCYATRDDITDLCGVDQLCSGLKCGIEGSVHAMRELYEEKHSDGWGLLLVDARNAFNSLNRAAPFGTLVFNGLTVPDSCLTPIAVIHHLFYKDQPSLKLSTAKKELVKVTLCPC